MKERQSPQWMHLGGKKGQGEKGWQYRGMCVFYEIGNSS